MEWTYEKAGVSLQRSDSWIEILREKSKRATNPNVRGGIGGFAGLYDIGGGKILAACTDGVGTKLEVARMTGIFRGLGQDLVAMNVNDLVTCGASPLFFLDYIACGYLDPEVFGPIMDGIVEACASSGCALLGGETAEMPDVYSDGAFDLAGFAVGAVDGGSLLDGSSIGRGDVLVGLASSGIHSNGFSLVRKCLLEGNDPLPHDLVIPGGERSLGEILMTPTRLYVKQAASVCRAGLTGGMAHITGGGLEENIRRILPQGVGLSIDFTSWERPAIFELIKSRGVSEIEMRRVFNLGIGFVFAVPEKNRVRIMDLLRDDFGEDPTVIGEIS
ncbi:MAG TPA: phosphoribosylformylglycinamidine cyclo-ligase [Synergistales bacterium]|jgi:phosphoribosylformylglycinamidine cyclo-ligase|nr:phosphoribosylformylglycinamidine cyclo-ligase [Synergistales bacterium]HRV70746.1 phosphoribosylformylglycinamidine cyclo-ligase [Thermovirgaceae bacterium]